MLTGENGILTQVQNAKDETEKAQNEEENVLDNYAQYIEGSTNGGTLTEVTGNETSNTKVQDSLENTIWVPAGFKVVNPGDNVEDGIVIEDVSHGATEGSQFVWIPVGENIRKSDGTTFNIILGRCVFDENGIVNEKGLKTKPEEKIEFGSSSGNIYEFTEGVRDEKTENVHAKDIEDFIDKTNSAGGYYIGRYEARTPEKERIAKTEDSALTQVTLKPNDYVYNYITQSQAANISRNMYNDSNFTSDLMNSFAWDTAINFLQKCDDRTNNKSKVYSQQNRVTSIFGSQGTNNLDVEDKICNIYDIASNCLEWTTESSSGINLYFVSRGGNYRNGISCPNTRFSSSADRSEDYNSFRPIIYL